MNEIKSHLASLATKLTQVKDQLATEEATKNALIMPFIANVLGYSVFDINEVVPEFIADVGVKKGEKVDYAIMHEGNVSILIECKKINQTLSLENASQLFRYFTVTNARIAVLTNGQIYEFYTDLDSPNRMDEKPFMTLDLLDIDPAIIPQLAKLCKNEFDINSILSAAETLKYVSRVKKFIANQFKEIEPDLLKLILNRVYSGRVTQKVCDQLQPIVQTGLNQFITDQVNVRLKKALGDGIEASTPVESAPVEPVRQEPPAEAEIMEDDSGIITTEEEIEGFFIVRAICCDLVDVERIALRDAKSYCAILLDDNNRKTICRLYFNASQWYLGVMNEDKTATREPIETLSDIYKFKDALRETIKRFL